MVVLYGLENACRLWRRMSPSKFRWYMVPPPYMTLNLGWCNAVSGQISRKPVGMLHTSKGIQLIVCFCLSFSTPVIAFWFYTNSIIYHIYIYIYGIYIYIYLLISIQCIPPQTNIAPENRPGPKRKRSSSNHPFAGAFAFSFREGIYIYILF